VIIDLNGAATELTDDTTLIDLIEARLGGTRGSAVVVDGSVVPRSAWPEYRVTHGQHIELITAVQGG
jgi:sulfur carrier protein